MQNDPKQTNDFKNIRYRGSVIREFVELALKTKKYWMLPLFLILLFLALLLIFGETAAAPFIYSLF